MGSDCRKFGLFKVIALPRMPCHIDTHNCGLPLWMQGYDWGRHSGQTLADVGGGTGRLLAAILRQQPSMRGILFERCGVGRGGWVVVLLGSEEAKACA